MVGQKQNPLGGVLQPNPHVLGFSQWCLTHEELLVVLVMGSEVRNDLCLLLGDITLRIRLQEDFDIIRQWNECNEMQCNWVNISQISKYWV